jgi:Fur family transcriptional regulator, ferric uptake regulator
MTKDLDGAAVARLREMGQRLTASRREVLDALRSAGKPLSMPEILSARADLAQSSVYRNLVVLEQAGVVHRIVTAGDYARYELVDDLTEHHHHLICSSCGAVEDFEVPPRLDRSVRSAMHDVAEQRGFVVRSHRLDVVGLCRACAALHRS